MNRRENLAKWYPVIFMYTGWGMCLLQFMIALITFFLYGKVFIEPAFLGLFGSMAGVGHITDAIREFMANPPSKELPGPPTQISPPSEM
jgi:hypothetical protein